MTLTHAEQPTVSNQVGSPQAKQPDGLGDGKQLYFSHCEMVEEGKM